MKCLLILFCLFLLNFQNFAQAPELLSYQAVIRDNSGNLVINQSIGIRISILQGSITGVAVYIETFNQSTNDNGLISVEIGSGTILFGQFSSVDWSNGPYFIKTETDPSGSSNYSISNTSQLLSVPYALHASTADSVTGTLNELDPVFNLSVAASITNADTAYWNDKLDVEMDGSISNELQTISVSEDTLFLSNGGFVVFPMQNWDSLNGNIFNANSGNVGIGLDNPTQQLEVDGAIQTDSLKIGSGDMIQNIQGGKVVLGQSQGLTLITVNVVFNNPFNNIPKVVCTPHTESGTNYDDSFNLTLRNVSTTGFEIIVNRVDGSTWGQNIEAFWMAFD